MKPFDSALVARLIDLAIDEDLSFGDPTSDLLPENCRKSAEIVARQDLVVCGLPLTEKIIMRSGMNIAVAQDKAAEGMKVKSGTVMQIIDGSVSDLTRLERTILNFLQRLCGVATFTRSVVDCAGSLTLLDTRKTMPGFRLLDKYATSVGGARNHRMHLGEMILVKNNHIDAAAGDTIEQKVQAVLNRVRSSASYYLPLQVEIRNEDELKAALKFSPTAVLLDNMQDTQISRCVKIIKETSPATLCEVSGGVQPERLSILAGLGVDAVSMGRLTTMAPNADISMRIAI